MQMISGAVQMKAEERPYHWLGSGIYFWENDPIRAKEWAEEKANRNELRDPFVVGAVIELRRCLDLSNRENVPLLEAAHLSLKALFEKSGTPMPINKKAPKDPREDNVLRYLDCAVINHLCENSAPPLDTVRGLFVEGGKVFPGSEIYSKTHAEIAVRNTECIRGLFVPL